MYQPDCNIQAFVWFIISLKLNTTDHSTILTMSMYTWKWNMKVISLLSVCYYIAALYWLIVDSTRPMTPKMSTAFLLHVLTSTISRYVRTNELTMYYVLGYVHINYIYAHFTVSIWKMQKLTRKRKNDTIIWNRITHSIDRVTKIVVRCMFQIVGNNEKMCTQK